MIEEKFHDTGYSTAHWEAAIAKAVVDINLERSPQGKWCLLYILAKAKSLRTSKWSFRGISASPTRILKRHILRVGTPAFMCMLRMLQQEIPHNFQFADIK